MPVTLTMGKPAGISNMNHKPLKRVYRRSRLQKQREDWTEKGPVQRGFEKSRIDAPKIEYKSEGDKI